MKPINWLKVLTINLIFFSCLACENNVEKATKFWQANKQDEAITTLKDEITKKPDNEDAKKLLNEFYKKISQKNVENAKKLWEENKQEQAISTLKNEIAKNPDNVDAKNQLNDFFDKISKQNIETAKKLWEENNKELAISKLKDELIKHPGNTDAQTLLENYQMVIEKQNIEKVASDSIRKQMNFPKIIFNNFFDIPQSSPLGQEILRLIKEGFIILQNPSPGTTYVKPTEKGKNIIKDGHYNYFYKTFTVNIGTHSEDLYKITEILIDSKSGEALVKFDAGFKPTEFFNSIEKLAEKYYAPFYQKNSYNKLISQKIGFKKWDSGWRIKEN